MNGEQNIVTEDGGSPLVHLELELINRRRQLMEAENLLTRSRKRDRRRHLEAKIKVLSDIVLELESQVRHLQSHEVRIALQVVEHACLEQALDNQVALVLSTALQQEIKDLLQIVALEMAQVVALEEYVLRQRQDGLIPTPAVKELGHPHPPSTNGPTGSPRLLAERLHIPSLSNGDAPAWDGIKGQEAKSRYLEIAKPLIELHRDQIVEIGSQVELS